MQTENLVNMHLIVESKPWRLLFPMRPLEMTGTTLLALLDFREQPQDAWIEHLTLGGKYRLRFDQSADGDVDPFYWAELREKKSGRLGWELLFEFSREFHPYFGVAKTS